MQVTESLGSRAGSNLFHSFGRFDVTAAESVTFSADLPTDNVISRITGGEMSTVEGRLASSIPGASLWFLNPAGFMFGSGASLNIQGSLHVSTADYLDFGNGDRFSVNLADSVGTSLSMSDPRQFGFLEGASGTVTAQYVGLGVPEGQGITIAASSINLEGSLLSARGGELDLSGESLSLLGSTLDVGGSGTGEIVIVGGEIYLDDGSQVLNRNESANAGGGIEVSADSIVMANKSIMSTSPEGAGKGGDITIRADETLSMESGAILETASVGTGAAGDIRIVGGSVMLDGWGWDETPTQLLTTARIGGGGAIELDVASLRMSNGAHLFAGSTGSGPGGSITIDANDHVWMDGNFYTWYPAVLRATATSSGAAGNIVINTPLLEVTNGARIRTRTRGSGAAGDITLNADEIRMHGRSDQSGLVNQVFVGTNGTGHGGTLTMNAEAISLSDTTAIQAASAFNGDTGGDVGHIVINTGELNMTTRAHFYAGGWESSGAPGSILVNADLFSMTHRAEISTARAWWDGDGGDIVLDLGRLEITNGLVETVATRVGTAGNITITAGSVETFGGRFDSAAWWGGQAGDISFDVDGDIYMDTGEFSTIPEVTDWFRSGIESDGLGDAHGGSVTIQAANLTLVNHSIITSSGRDAGDITVNVENMIHLNRGGWIQGNTHLGYGGDIYLTANEILIEKVSSVVTDIFDQGIQAGSINVKAHNLTLRDAGELEAAACLCTEGSAGSINIDLTGTLIVTGYILDDSYNSGRDDSAISTSTRGKGNAGDININAKEIIVSDYGHIDSRSLTPTQGVIFEIVDGVPVVVEITDPAGYAGTIDITAENMSVTDNGGVTTVAYLAAGGSVNLNIEDTLYVNEGEISSAATGVTEGDSGGDVTIDPRFVILDNARIFANANAGDGGNILISGQYLFTSADSVLDASSKKGIDGQVVLDSPNTVTSAVDAIAPPDFEAPELLRDKCKLKIQGGQSSLTVEGREGVEETEWILSPLSGAGMPKHDDTLAMLPNVCEAGADG
jgi:filamentous hemagglutinin family protein